MFFIKKIGHFIINNRLLKPQLPVLVAVSGGADSVVLLDTLIRLGYNCSAAHCNFHLRGEDSDNDAFFVENLARKYNIPFFLKSFDTAGQARESRESIEMTARKLRYEWFDELVQKFDFQAVAVAHHKNDLAETILLNLVRGTGIRGLAALKPKRDKIIRPLLCVNRLEIESYAQETMLLYCTDKTNSDVNIVRNRIRHNILPEMEKINPAAIEKFSQFSDIIIDAIALYNSGLKQIVRDVFFDKNDIMHIDIPYLLKSPAPKTTLYEILKNYGFNANNVENIYRNIKSRSGKIFLSDKYKIIKDRHFLFLSALENVDNQTFTIEKDTFSVEKPLKMRLSIFKRSEIETIKTPPNVAFFDCKKVKFPLVLRHWQAGDSFRPLGAKGTKKISDFFINQHFNLIEKEQTWLLFSNEKIAWVVNHRIDERFKIDSQTRRVLRVEVLEN
ncbi:MAG: tRNA lysidine(34) synthetase TilS [Prevotellaceae bacterium]|jgi:tRNA(Ile)-lysidine synthase|nr:tRNA lysidine(34) synthetase TilS [Prevotellaceae bacterium]